MKNITDLQRGQSPDSIKQTVEDLHLELESTGIAAIVYSVVEQMLPNIHSRNQSLTLNLEPTLPKVTVDALRIEQILLNLLSNAVKNTPDGGSIALSANNNGGSAVIKIRDNAPIIPSEEQHEVFKPHYRLKGDNERHLPGIGLGLALCKYLVELHGGNIWVEDEQSSGNTFALSLPLEKA